MQGQSPNRAINLPSFHDMTSEEIERVSKVVLHCYNIGDEMIEDEAFKKLAENNELREKAHSVFMSMCDHKYSYHFSWLGRPIIQFPQDVLAVQEIIWKIKPDLIIETE